MSTRYKNKEVFRNVFSWCTGMVYVPIDKAHDAWLIIMLNDPNNDKCILFWIVWSTSGSTTYIFKSNVECVQSKYIRTNNPEEAWNSELNKLNSIAHPTNKSGLPTNRYSRSETDGCGHRSSNRGRRMSI